MYILYHHNLYKGVYTIVYMTNNNNISKLLKELQGEMKKLNIPEEVLDREIKPFGNASHIILPEKYKGKKAKVIIKK